MTDKEIMEMFIQVHKCLDEITMTLNFQAEIPITVGEQVTKLEIIINQTANRTNLPAIETELYSLTKNPLK